MRKQASDPICKNRFLIRHYVAEGGRRFSLLYDSAGDGMPMLYPTAFCSRVYGSRSANTQRQLLDALKELHEWEAAEGIDLATLLQSGSGLTDNQIDSLSEYFGAKKQKNKKRSKNNRLQIHPKSFNTKLNFTTDYLQFLFGHVRQDPNSTENRDFISDLKNRILMRKRKTGSKTAYAQELIQKKLPDAAREALLERFESPSLQGETIFQQGINIRNNLMLRILYDLGLRLGELLSLTLGNILHAAGGETGYLIVERNQDDAYDRRVNQPVAKTVGRKLAISSELEDAILTYLGSWRADVPGAGFKGNSFLFIVHKAGPNQGRELEISTVRSLFSRLPNDDKRLLSLHPHLLRHDWNYRFSQECEKLKLSEDAENSDRCVLMGWKIGSAMAKHYNLRHIIESANKLGLAVASDTSRSRRPK